ncbi:MAG: TPM domain-containing protein [Bacteroidales bacterium]|nr:TPM domain-containing protein [Bacteroidales bacterium]
MKTTKRHILLFGMLITLLLGTTVKAQLPSPPYPPRLVNDYTGTLTYDQAETLERMLVNYNDTTSTQILVLLVDDLQGYSIDQYATEIGHSWGVGQQDKGNGVVIVVKPKTSSEKGQVSISTGYGMEGIIADATAKNIIEREMIPAFKEEDYYGGIVNAVNVIMDLCSGKFTQDDYNDEGNFWLGILVIIAIILVIRWTRGSRSYSGSGMGSGWISSGGGFGGGGGHGGGFSGFGGGGFGGGGASGSW